MDRAEEEEEGEGGAPNTLESLSVRSVIQGSSVTVTATGLDKSP